MLRYRGKVGLPASAFLLLALNIAALAHPPLKARICRAARAIIASGDLIEIGRIPRFATAAETSKFKKLVDRDNSQIAGTARIENPVYKELNDEILQDLKLNDDLELLWKQTLLRYIQQDPYLMNAILTHENDWGLYNGAKDGFILFRKVDDAVKIGYGEAFQGAVVEYLAEASKLLSDKKYADVRARMAAARTLAKSFGTHHLSSVSAKKSSKLTAWDRVSLATLLTRESRGLTAQRAIDHEVPDVMEDSPENLQILYGRMEALQKAYQKLYETFPKFFPRGYRNQFAEGPPDFSPVGSGHPKLMADGVLHPELNVILRKVPKQNRATYVEAIAAEGRKRTGKQLSADLKELLEGYYAASEAAGQTARPRIEQRLDAELGHKGVAIFREFEAEAEKFKARGEFLKLKYIRDQIRLRFGDPLSLEEVKVIAAFFTEADRWDPPILHEERTELDFASLKRSHLVVDFGGFGARNASALQMRLRRIAKISDLGKRGDEQNFNDLLSMVRLARDAEQTVTADLMRLRKTLGDVAVQVGVLSEARRVNDPLARQMTGDDLILYPDEAVEAQLQPGADPTLFHRYYLEAARAIVKEFDGDFDIANLNINPTYGEGNSQHSGFAATARKTFKETLFEKLIGSDYEPGVEMRKVMLSFEMRPGAKGEPGTMDLVITSPREAKLNRNARTEILEKAKRLFAGYPLGEWKAGRVVDNIEYGLAP